MQSIMPGVSAFTGLLAGRVYALEGMDMDENRRSIKKIAELEAEVVCFGHGRPLTHDAVSQVCAFAAKL